MYTTIDLLLRLKLSEKCLITEQMQDWNTASTVRILDDQNGVWVPWRVHGGQHDSKDKGNMEQSYTWQLRHDLYTETGILDDTSHDTYRHTGVLTMHSMFTRRSKPSFDLDCRESCKCRTQSLVPMNRCLKMECSESDSSSHCHPDISTMYTLPMTALCICQRWLPLKWYPGDWTVVMGDIERAIWSWQTWKTSFSPWYGCLPSGHSFGRYSHTKRMEIVDLGFSNMCSIRPTKGSRLWPALTRIQSPAKNSTSPWRKLLSVM